jgi:hypothetical protein
MNATEIRSIALDAINEENGKSIVRQYANFRIDGMDQNQLMDLVVRAVKVTRIRDIVIRRDRGTLTTDEAIMMIADC